MFLSEDKSSKRRKIHLPYEKVSLGGECIESNFFSIDAESYLTNTTAFTLAVPVLFALQLHNLI